MEPWIKVDLVIICVLLSWLGLKLLRILKITSKIRGPSFFELITVHAKHLLSKDLLAYMTNLCAQHEHKPVGLWLAHDFIVLISDPDSVKDVFKQAANKASAVFDPIITYIGRSSITLNGRRWRHHRNIINLIFHRAIMEKRRKIYNEEAEDLVKKIQLIQKFQNVKTSNQDIEIDALIDEQNVSAAVRGLTSDTFIFDDISQYCKEKSLGMKAVQINVINPLYRWFGRHLPRGWRTNSLLFTAINRYKKQFAELRNAAAEYYKDKEFDPKDSLDCLVRGNLKTGNVFNEQQFCDELFFLIVAHETSAHTTVLVLLLLSLHQEVQQRVFEEIDSIFGQSQRAITAEDLGELVYLDMVIKETLRLFPAVPFLGRQIDKETNINGTVLPEGATAIINVFALHRNPKNFKDPLKFDPDRFLPGAFQELHPFGYLPFSYGERSCPGNRQGMMALKIFTTILLRNFKILPGEGLNCIDDIKVKMCVVVQAYESRVKFVRRYEEESPDKLIVPTVNN